jgi:hypothetical protein
MKPDLKTTYGKNNTPELPVVREHLRYGALVAFFVERDAEGRLLTKVGIACQVSDADLRDN